MFSPNNDPISETRKMTQNRVLMLSQKINNLKFGYKAQSQKKLDIIQRTCENLQEEIQNIKAVFDNQCFDIKHIMENLEKQLNHDYAGTDRMVKEQIKRCQDRFIQMTENHMSDRKKSDGRLAKFMDQKCSILRDLIQREATERNTKAQQIEESLRTDLAQIKGKLEDQKATQSENLEQIHSQFLNEYEQMRREFDQICEKSSINEGQFYKMLRDILKKVKEELSQAKVKREQMEETILALIEKICDKAMQEVSL